MSSERFYSMSEDGSERASSSPPTGALNRTDQDNAGTKRGIPLTLPSRGDNLRLRTASLDSNQKSILAEFDALVEGEKELLDREKKILGSADLRSLKKMPAGGIPLLKLTDGHRSDAALPAGWRRGRSAFDRKREPTSFEIFAGNALAALLASTHVILMQLHYPIFALA